MDATSAIDQLFSYFAVVQDPRRQHPMTHHSLEAILIITILGTICGAQNWVEIEQWGEARQAWLSEFLELPYGIPSHATFGRVFALLDPAGLHQAFLSWMNALATQCEDVIALDGKTIRRSLDRTDGKGPMHVVSAWASRNERSRTCALWIMFPDFSQSGCAACISRRSAFDRGFHDPLHSCWPASAHTSAVLFTMSNRCLS